MDYPSLVQAIQDSYPSDWLYEEELGIWTSRSDVRVNLNRVELDRDEFVEGWTEEFPDSSAETLRVDLKYSGSFVKRYAVVLVDGGRHYIPLPTPALKISHAQYHLGRIINRDLVDYERALKTAGITVE